MDSSVSDTIRTLITLGNHRAAQRVKVDFKVLVPHVCATLQVCSAFLTKSIASITHSFYI